MSDGGITAFSTSFEALEDGGSRMVVATIENGQIFSMQLGAQETLDNLCAWARVLGLIVSRPL